MKDTSSLCAASALTRLEKLLTDEADKERPPIHLWDPAARPDIGLAIQRDGTWTHEGSPFERVELVKLFASVLRREGDGRFFVVTPVEKVPVRVVDAPFMAVELQVRGSGPEQELIWRTNVDDAVIAGKEHPIRFETEQPDGGLKPYVMLRHGLEARVTRSLYYDLVNMATTKVVEGVEQIGVWSDGTFFAMADAAGLEDLADSGAAL